MLQVRILYYKWEPLWFNEFYYVQVKLDTLETPIQMNLFIEMGRQKQKDFTVKVMKDVCNTNI